MKQNKKFLVFMSLVIILSALLIVNLVSALGVTPAAKLIAYKPGEAVSGSVSVINSEHKDMKIYISTEGDMKSGLFIQGPQTINILASESSKQIPYTFTVPDGLAPGRHSADIIISQPLDNGKGGQTFVGSTLAVRSTVDTFVPFPGKYLEATLDVTGAAQGGEVSFVIPMINHGLLDINRVHADIEIYNAADEKVAVISSNDLGVKSGERAEIDEKWSADIPIGTYKVLVKLVFDESTITLEGTFKVGDIEVELQEVRVKEFSLGSIAKFEMLVQNKWSEPIRLIYSQTQVTNDKGDVIADFTSPTYDINPSENKTFYSYWDTDGVSVGRYNASVYLKYGDKTARKDLTFNVQEDSIEIFGLGYVISEKKTSTSKYQNIIITLIVVIVILVLVNISWFLSVRRKLLKKNGNNAKK